MKKILSVFSAVLAMTATAGVAMARDAENALPDAEPVVLEAPVSPDAPAAEGKETFKDHLQNHYKFYGFIRNYFVYDSRESWSGTGDLYYWMPKDEKLNAYGEDMNLQNQFRFLSLTSRVGVDVSGYRVGRTDFGAKIEADFYAGLDGVTGTAQLRLRLAYMTIGWKELGKNRQGSIQMRLGQDWHPMAADLPDIFSLESGAPFNPFSRTPQVTTNFNFNSNWSITCSLLWQMQYKSAGPEGASANYIKYSYTPDIYLGLNYRNGGFLGRVGAEMLSIKPRHTAEVAMPEGGTTTANVKDRITTLSPYLYLQYTKNLLKIKAKTVYGSAGEHINLMSGYAVTSIADDNSLWEYTPIHTSSTWMTVAYGKKVMGAIMLGYIRNLGTAEDIYRDENGNPKIYFQGSGDSSYKRMVRIQPEITYNVGKFTLGLEYMLTGVQYGNTGADGKKHYSAHALCTGGTHLVWNNRVQAMVKFNF